MLALSAFARSTMARNINLGDALPGGGRRGDGDDACAVAALVAALDCIGQGAIVADATARVILANQAARRLLDAGDGLAIDAAGLRAALPDDTRQLRALIAAASVSLQPAGAAAGGTLVLARTSLRRPLWIVVAPLLRPPADLPMRAVLFISDPDRDTLPSVQQLRRLYALTRAEAEVALLVARGEGLNAVAHALEITRATARTHLTRVFEKTGTSRQAELVGILLRSGLDAIA